MWDIIFLKQILRNRNFTSYEINKYIDQHKNHYITIPQFLEFLDIIRKSESILIVGDYDVDGIVSSAILFFVLKNMFKDNKKIDIFIPNRFMHGYGINAKTTEFIIKKYSKRIDTVITVDNGVSFFNEIGILRNMGLKVIIIDHHKVGSTIPNANLIIHPNFFDLGYGYLCASGIVYKLALFILNWMKGNQYLEKVFTFLAGMATIADVVPLLEDNRVIVKKLFKLLENNFIPLPILKLFNRAYRKDSLPSNTFHFSHIIIPRLNAPGRIDDPYISFNFIYKSIKQEESTEEINIIEEINRKRQEIQQRILNIVMKNIEDNKLYNDAIIIPDYIDSNDLGLGVIGVIAGKIANNYRKPAFVFVRNSDILKGSARNPIESLDITDIINRAKDLVIKFGGHKKAAGLEIKLQNFEKFRAELSNLPLKQYHYNIDLELPPFFFHKFIKYSKNIFEIMEPFGEKNEKPILKLINMHFVGDMVNFNYKVVIRNYNNSCNEAYLKIDNIVNETIYFDNLLPDLPYLKTNNIEKILFLERVYLRDIHFVDVNLKSLDSLSILLNSYEKYILILNRDEYEKIRDRVKVAHFIILEENLSRDKLIQYIENAQENVFITNENILKGVIIFYKGADLRELNYVGSKGIVFVKLNL